MAATSLAEQLKRLQRPQTSQLLLDRKEKPSILFEKKDAANKDRDTIYEIGLSGLEELIALNGDFQVFATTLFDRSAKDLERAVEDSEVNRKLDRSIKSFLIRLSPYFMLQATHKCIEWLIRRFHVESFNQDEILMAILPFYESRMFVRCVQVLDLKGAEKKWGWLEGTKKSGQPLSKQTIMNHAGSDAFFLQFVGKMLVDSVKEHGHRAYTLQALIGFYTTTVIGALEGVKDVTENHVIAIFPALLKGLSANVLDFTAASYMVLGQLLSKTAISPNSLDKIISRIAMAAPPGLQMDATMLLVLIYQTQQSHFSQISEEALTSVTQATWIPQHLGELVSQGVQVDRFISPVLALALRRVQKKVENYVACKKFCENLLLEVRFTNEEAEAVIRCALSSYVLREKHPEVVTIDSGDESDIPLSESNMDVSSWYSNFLKTLERQYPETFDAVIKQIMSSTEDISEGRRTALKAVLGFLLKVSFRDGEDSVFEKLYHHQAKFRVEAVKYLVKNFTKITISHENEDFLKDSLAERLKDDNPKVVEQVLKLPKETLCSLMGPEVLFERLLVILSRSSATLANWNKAKLACIHHLTSSTDWNTEQFHKIFIAVFPYIFPKSNDSLELTKVILNSHFASQSSFLQKCLKKIQKTKSDTAEDYRYGAHEVLLEKLGLPEAKDLLRHIEIESMGSEQKFYALLLVASALEEAATPEISLQFLDIISKSLHTVEIVKKDIRKSHEIIHSNKLPMSLFSQCFESIIRCTDFQGAEDFTDETLQPVQELQIRLFDLLLKRFFGSLQQEETKKIYEGLLKGFLEKISSSPEGKLNFLANFFISHTLSESIVSPEFQLRTVKLTNAILESSPPDNISDGILRKFLIGLCNENPIIRRSVIETWEILAGFSAPGIKLFAELLLQQKEELEMDNEQLSLILYNILAPNRSELKKRKFSEQKLLASVRDSCLDFAGQECCKLRHIQGYLLRIFEHINDAEILSKLAPVATAVIKQAGGALTAHESLIVRQIILRFNQDTIKGISQYPKTWECIEEIMKSNTLLADAATGEEAPATPAMAFADNFDTEMFAVFNEKYQEDFFQLIVSIATFSEVPEVVASLGNLVKRIDFDAKIMQNILEEMQKVKIPAGDKKKTPKIVPSVDILKTKEWQMGVTMLEFIQTKKKIANMKVLLSVLFGILKRCVDFEEQSPVEYTKQIVLSSILLSCQDIEDRHRDIVNESVFKIDLVVQCIRASYNPQTHHHALQLICFVSSIIPEQVLHNMMDIFTFMGSSVVRQDDAYSFQIIGNIIENVIPILVQKNSTKPTQEAEFVVAPVLNVFVDIILDVPEHRRLPMYVKLIDTLGPDENLWLFLEILFGSHVIQGTKVKKDSRQDAAAELPKRLQVALAIANEFPPDVVVVTCTKLIERIQKILQEQKESVDKEKSTEVKLFNLEGATDKQMRHFKYITIQFVSNVTSSGHFVTKVAKMNGEDFQRMKPFYQNIIIRELMLIGEASKALDRHPEQHKYWKVILHHCYDILDNCILLLSPDMFLVVINGLIQHKLMTVRRKVIELLINKLQQKDQFFRGCDDSNFLQVLAPLRAIIDTIVPKEEKETDNEAALVQQVSLIAVKILSKILAENQTEIFKELLMQLIGILKKHKALQSIILASVVLTIAEICSNLRVHALSGLSVFMPIFLQILHIHCQDNETVDMTTVSIIAAMQKVIDTLPLFLSPYLVKMLTLIARIRVKVQKITPQDAKTASILGKIDSMTQKVSSFIPLRILVPAVDSAYSQLIEEAATDAVAPLMSILSDAFVDVPTKDIAMVQVELSEFFLRALKFRSANPTLEDVNAIEERIVKALVSLILKLSEGSFKPLYYRIYDWAIREEENRDRVITFYSLSHHIAKTLKSLFVVLAVDFVQNAAELLNSCNLAKVATEEELYYANDAKKCETLLENILQTFLHICTYDSRQFMTVHRCEIILQPLIDQLDNPLVQKNNLKTLLSTTIASLGAAGADNLWQQLNYGVLLKTRHTNPEVRLLALGTCVEFARKIGQDFQSLLPETIPFLSELLEDENEEVERGCKRLIHDLEGILNDSLQKYF
ncbi:HEAT repeat-containing protein 1 homolog [Lutzomyia longipalpis]|uniref:HEAT repeat-containing protein 1 homolog n=1 Tax=Lutzomyia longipalpis TaxID=7200 RepID=UPI0024843AF3|nr:HEAT repeat-containing protein 1 homolog [Lutzomyia longipalpis]